MGQLSFEILKDITSAHYIMKGVLAFAALSVICIGTLVSGNALKTETTYTVKDHKKLVGCYWGTWAFYRPGFGKFDVTNIDTSLCTHGFYGFADLNSRTEDPHAWELVAYDPWLIKHQMIVMIGPTIVTQMGMVQFVAILIPIED